MDQLVSVFNSIPNAIRPLLSGIIGCMVIFGGLMVLTAGRSSTQVAGGLLTIRNVVFGAIIVVIGGAFLIGFLGSAGINVGGAPAAIR